MKNSCGAILYTFDKEGKIGVILGCEGFEEWLPFKGCNEEGETYEQTAIREIREETCGLVDINSIVLEHVFTTKHKIYRIGLCQVDFDIIEKFALARSAENRKEFREKQEIKFFALETVFAKPSVHSISRASIKFYWDKLMTIAGKQVVGGEHIRCHGMTEEQAKNICTSALIDLHINNTADDIDNLHISSGDNDVFDETLIDSPKTSDSRQSKSSGSSPRQRNNDQLLKRKDLNTFLTKRDAKTCTRRKSANDSRGYTKREYNLSRPKRIGLSYTPMAEKRADEGRSWR